MGLSTPLSLRRRSSLVVMPQIAFLVVASVAVCQDQWPPSAW